jgi:hypothetical protein
MRIGRLSFLRFRKSTAILGPERNAGSILRKCSESSWEFSGTTWPDSFNASPNSVAIPAHGFSRLLIKALSPIGRFIVFNQAVVVIDQASPEAGLKIL